MRFLRQNCAFISNGEFISNSETRAPTQSVLALTRLKLRPQPVFSSQDLLMHKTRPLNVEKLLKEKIYFNK